MGTESPDYTDRLTNLQGARWKRLLDVQRPYRWNVRRVCRGKVLDLGCGVGRNLTHLQGRGVGVDHNVTSIATARAQGLVAFTNEEFLASEHAQLESFDSLLAAHVLEHVAQPDADALLGEFLPFLKPGGRVVLITPQELGWGTDATHVRWVDFNESASTCERLGLQVERRYSWPLPRPVGRVFPYNEFVVLAEKPSAGSRSETPGA